MSGTLPQDFLGCGTMKQSKTNMGSNQSMASLLGTSSTPNSTSYTYTYDPSQWNTWVSPIVAPTVTVTTGEIPKMNKRLVKVVIVDPHPSVPAENSLIYQDVEPRLTDANDEELYLDIDIKGLLAKHNEYRVTLDESSGNISFGDTQITSKKLKPARLRDLKRQVIVLANF